MILPINSAKHLIKKYYQLCQKSSIKQKGIKYFPTYFYEASIFLIPESDNDITRKEHYVQTQISHDYKGKFFQLIISKPIQEI